MKRLFYHVNIYSHQHHHSEKDGCVFEEIFNGKKSVASKAVAAFKKRVPLVKVSHFYYINHLTYTSQSSIAFTVKICDLGEHKQSPKRTLYGKH